MLEVKDQIDLIARFLNEIGIPVIFEPIEEKTFLPGILIDRGKMIVDRDQLTYPGDLLHEAGHIAVITPEERQSLRGDATVGGMGAEIVAILWSFAAAKAINLPEEIVFHAGGYQNVSSWFIESFRDNQQYMGLPLLEWMGMTAGPEKAQIIGVPPFPHMIHWLRP